jgi:hypothetical protein
LQQDGTNSARVPQIKPLPVGTADAGLVVGVEVVEDDAGQAALS